MQVSRNPADADDLAIFPKDRLLEGQAPATAPTGVEMEFEVVADRISPAQDFPILKRERIPKRGREDFFCSEA